MNAPTTFDASWLMRQQFPPLRYVVPGLIPEGLSILASTPKIGKSWMVLGLALAVSGGRSAFDAIPTGEPRPVRYFALEDGARRLQDRLISLNPGEVSELLTFTTVIDQGKVIETIRDYVIEHAASDPVVIVDTLGRVMPPAGQSNAYAHDYAVMSQLKRIVDDCPGSSLVLVHHTRKSGGEDFLDAVSGTQGIAGAADTVLVLRRERHEPRATLNVTSRDAAEGEYSLTLQESGRWELDGHDLASAAEAARSARATSGVGDRMAEVIETVGRYPEGIKPKDLKTLLPHVNGIDEYLSRAVTAGRLSKIGRGLYTPVRTVRSVSNPNTETHMLTVITPEQGEDS